MWPWYFILTVILLMVIVQIIAASRKTISGFKAIFPRFNEESAEELTPYYKNKSQVFIEKLTNTPCLILKQPLTCMKKL